MPKPITPLVSCETFVTNKNNEVLLVQRRSSGVWAMPGGFHDLGETPEQCATREFQEETGYQIKVTNLIGVYSSNNYEYKYYQWKDNEIIHLLFAGKIISGAPETSKETMAIKWFAQDNLPEFFDGHDIRVAFGFKWLNKLETLPHFE